MTLWSLLVTPVRKRVVVYERLLARSRTTPIPADNYANAKVAIGSTKSCRSSDLAKYQVLFPV